jgi:hypothetical protein
MKDRSLGGQRKGRRGTQEIRISVELHLVVVQITKNLRFARYNWVTNVPVWFALFTLEAVSKLHLSVVS